MPAEGVFSHPYSGIFLFKFRPEDPVALALKVAPTSVVKITREGIDEVVNYNLMVLRAKVKDLVSGERRIF
jgi:hypothetical protein